MLPVCKYDDNQPVINIHNYDGFIPSASIQGKNFKDAQRNIQ